MRREQMVWSADATRAALNLQRDPKLLLCLDPGSTGGKMLLTRALHWDCPISVVLPHRNPMIELDIAHGFTFISLVPLQLQQILKDPESLEKLNRFECVLLGGAGIQDSFRQQIQALPPRVIHSYGMTETCSHIAIRPLNHQPDHIGFHPLPGILLSQDRDGRLIIDSPTGVERPLLTNDLVEFLDDGSFLVVGRADNTINSGGVKIQLEVIDQLISYLILPIYPDRNTFTWYRPDPELGQKLVLVVEGQDMGPEVEANMLRLLKKELPPYKAPKEIIFAPTFSYSPSGKVDKLKTWSEYGEKQA